MMKVAEALDPELAKYHQHALLSEEDEECGASDDCASCSSSF